MVSPKICMFVLVCCAITGSGSAVSVRRDAQWPPPILKSFMRPMHKECVKKTGVSEEAIVRFSDGESFDNDEQLKCYMSCVFQKAGVTDDQSILHLDKLVRAVGALDDDSEIIFLKMAKRCLRPVVTTHCETAFWFNQCWKASDPVHYFLL